MNALVMLNNLAPHQAGLFMDRIQGPGDSVDSLVLLPYHELWHPPLPSATLIRTNIEEDAPAVPAAPTPPGCPHIPDQVPQDERWDRARM